MIQGDDVQIYLYNQSKKKDATQSSSENTRLSDSKEEVEKKQDNSEPVDIFMKKADYFMSKNVVKSKDEVTVKTATSKTHSHGIILDLDLRKGYFIGPVTTTFLKQTTAMHQSTPKPLIARYHSAGILSLCMLTIPVMADPPAEVTSEQHAALDAAIQKPLSVQSSEEDQVALEQSLKRKNIGNKQSRDFLKSMGESQLIQTKDPAKAPVDLPKEAADAAPIKAEDKAEEKADNPEKADAVKKVDALFDDDDEDEGVELLNATSDGGMFFDAEKGYINYKENVVVIEPRFTLTCKKELHVYLQDGVVNDKKKNEKLVGIAATINNMIAIGSVRVKGAFVNKKKKSTRHMDGKAEIMTYDVEKGLIILKGGFPKIKVKEDGRTLTLTAKEPNLHISIQQDGSYRTSPGAWDQKITGVNKGQ